MENSYSAARVSGALLILAFCSLAGIASSFLYSGYLAIMLGIIAIALAIGTKSPESKRDRTNIFSMAAISVLLGVGAIALGIVSRALAQLV